MPGKKKGFGGCNIPGKRQNGRIFEVNGEDNILAETSRKERAAGLVECHGAGAGAEMQIEQVGKGSVPCAAWAWMKATQPLVLASVCRSLLTLRS